MRRNMQNISFLAIVGALLSCAFFFSQKTQANLTDQRATDALPAALKVETMADIPECPEALDAASASCFQDAAEAAEQLMNVKIKAILAVETDSHTRMDFLSAQQTWEESRHADCKFVRDLVDEPELSLATEQQCLRDHTLDRIATLETLLCEYYDPESCPTSIIATP